MAIHEVYVSKNGQGLYTALTAKKPAGSGSGIKMPQNVVVVSAHMPEEMNGHKTLLQRVQECMERKKPEGYDPSNPVSVQEFFSRYSGVEKPPYSVSIIQIPL